MCDTIPTKITATTTDIRQLWVGWKAPDTILRPMMNKTRMNCDLIVALNNQVAVMFVSMVIIPPLDHDHRTSDADGWDPAFSLLEIIVVLSIVAILSAVIMPQYAGALARYRNDAAARRVVADLKRVSEEARNTSTSQTLTFDVSGDNYRLVNIDRFDHKDLANIVELSGEPYYTTIVTADFEGGDTVVFDGYGSPDKGGSVVIGIGSAQKTVVFDKLSAKATIH